MNCGKVWLLRRACVLVMVCLWATFSHAQLTNFTVIHSFGFPELGGIEPRAGLIIGSDGVLYGTTSRSGLLGLTGTVFRVQMDVSGYRVLRHFGGNDGALIEGRLLEATDGALYGTASGGGNSNRGTIFRLNKDGQRFSVLHHFDGAPDGSTPFAALIEGTDGLLYGTTRFG